MNDLKPQPSLAVATAELMWACAFASARVAGTSAARGAFFWWRMLRRTAGRPLWPLPHGPGAFPAPNDAARTAASAACPVECEPPTEPETCIPPAEHAFASYRSAGGHAAAQVILQP
jgi:hypothetical protein